MQEAGESTGMGRRPAGAVPPLAVFLGLLAVLVVVGAVVLLTREAPPPTPTKTAPAEPNYALTDSEAITRFKELRSLRDSMYRSEDLSLLSLIYTDQSALRRIVTREIQGLAREGIRDRSRFEQRQLSVKSNVPEHIILRETVVIYPHFVDARGNDVSIQRRPVRRVIDWTLTAEEGVFLIEDSIIRSSEVLR